MLPMSNEWKDGFRGIIHQLPVLIVVISYLARLF